MIGYETTKLHKFILPDMNDSLYTKGYQYTVTLVQASVCDCFSIVEDLHVQLQILLASRAREGYLTSSVPPQAQLFELPYHSEV